MKELLKRFLLLFQPYVWRLAELYGLRVDRHCFPYGQYPLEIGDTKEASRHNIPKSVYFNTRSGKIVVGENTVFGENVQVLTGMHVSRHDHRSAGNPHHWVIESGRDIFIGKGCYIGGGAILIGPITIGEDAIIGAGSVVTKDVPARAFVAGIPAAVVKIL